MKSGHFFLKRIAEFVPTQRVLKSRLPLPALLHHLSDALLSQFAKEVLRRYPLNLHQIRLWHFMLRSHCFFAAAVIGKHDKVLRCRSRVFPLHRHQEPE